MDGMGSGLKFPFWILLQSLALCSCAALSSAPERDPAAAKAAAQPESPSAAPDSPSEINKIIEETNPVLSESSGENDKVPLQIPLSINRRVQYWIKFFTERERDRTTRYLERGEPLRPYIEAILKEYEIPAELYYLAMIESGFVTHAKSRAKAVGIWQFVKGTGKNYGLIVNSSVDERRNWIKATEAAAIYLRDLNNVFGSWYLALAAYNTGEFRIVRSIMRGKTRDFWALAEQGFLHQETMDYVPKFLAAHIVGRNYKRLGFELEIDPEDEWASWDKVSVPSGTRLTDLARVSSVPLEVLKRWNRDLLKGITPQSKTGSVDIYVPKTEVAKIEGAREQIAKLRRYGGGRLEYASRDTGGEGKSYEFYVVKRGDNIATISKRIGISSRTLMKINGLRRGRIMPGQRLKFYAPTAAADFEEYAEGGREPASKGRRRARGRKPAE
jgi:membrane-bound lytic murein transglycosylase D